MAESRISFALDQNFPPLIPDAAAMFPEVEIKHIHKIDPRLSDLGDRDLIKALRQLEWTGLITNDYRMLSLPWVVAAIVKTKLVIFAVQGVGDDPLRATGAVLLDLPGALKRLVPGKAQVFRSHPRNPQPEPPWKYFKEAARRHNREADELYGEVRVTDEELATPVLEW